MHSFGLYSTKGKKDYRFVLSATGAPLVKRLQSPPPDRYQIDLVTLLMKFEKSVQDYANDLNNNHGLQCKFRMMFPYYGSIDIKRD
jgi:hypothetical protein